MFEKSVMPFSVAPVEQKLIGDELTSVQGGEQVAARLQELKENASSFGRVLIVGSGGNSSAWQERGAVTLDIDESSGPDITANANTLSQIPEVNQVPWDVVVLECITRDPSGLEGVDMVGIVPQVYQVLKPGGELFIVTATIIDLVTPPAGPDEIALRNALTQAGFSEVIVHYGPTTGSFEGRQVGDKVVADEASVYGDGWQVFYAKK